MGPDSLPRQVAIERRVHRGAEVGAQRRIAARSTERLEREAACLTIPAIVASSDEATVVETRLEESSRQSVGHEVDLSRDVSCPDLEV
eukprot:1346319-Rhodomonas_salina.1